MSIPVIRKKTNLVGDYYVYTLAKLDGTVFYVGKGSAKRNGTLIVDRIDDHEKEAQFPLSEAKRRGFNLEKRKAILDIWEQGGQVIKQKVYETPVELEAYIYEWALIYLVYGIDNLTNRRQYGIRHAGIEVASPTLDTPIDLKKLHNLDEILSTTAVGQILGVSSTTVINIIKAGKLPSQRVGNNWKIRRRDVEIYLEACQYKPA